LLEFFGFLEVLEDKGVEVFLASNLELDLVGFLVFLDARRYREKKRPISKALLHSLI
jgi:hypothetical protein